MKPLYTFAIVTGLFLGLSLGGPSPATADSVADMPVPSLLGATGPTKHIYTVPNIMNFVNTTSFHCTSTEKTGGKNIRWGVEVYSAGILWNDVTIGEGVTTLHPGDSDIISLQDTGLFTENDTLDILGIFRGAARILADSNKIICSVVMLDYGLPQRFIAPLPIIKKTSQKGQ